MESTPFDGPFPDPDAGGMFEIEPAPTDADDWLAAGSDYGQAVLDGQNADDQHWLVDAAADVYWSDMDDTPFITVPTAAELALRGTLELAGDAERIEYLQEQFAVEVAVVADDLNYADTIGYEWCEADHAALAAEGDAAIAKLIEAVGDDDVEEASYGTCRAARYEGEYQLPDGQIVRATHHVRVFCDKDGKLINPFGSVPAIKVEANVHPAEAHSTDGVLPISVAAVPVDRSMRTDDVLVGDIQKVIDSMAHRARQEGWQKGVEPWVDVYAALPVTEVPIPDDEDFGAEDISLGMRALLGCQPVDAKEAALVLRFAFMPVGSGYMRVMLTTPVEQILEPLQRYGVVERYVWLLENAPRIMDSVRTHERTAVDVGLREKYVVWRQERAKAIGEVFALASELQQCHRLSPQFPKPVAVDKQQAVDAARETQRHFSATGRVRERFFRREP